MEQELFGGDRQWAFRTRGLSARLTPDLIQAFTRQSGTFTEPPTRRGHHIAPCQAFEQPHARSGLDRFDPPNDSGSVDTHDPGSPGKAARLAAGQQRRRGMSSGPVAAKTTSPSHMAHDPPGTDPMVFSPRDDAEFDVVRKLVARSQEFAPGTGLAARHAVARQASRLDRRWFPVTCRYA
ncbi:MAG: hypothetical protein AAF317_21430 [Pseudomonadota bacterium]